MWAVSYLKDEIFIRFKPYIAHYLKRESVANCDLIIIKVIDSVGHYLEFFSQLFGDLDETKTAKLHLLKLI
jgi:hypothetical protein